MGIGLKNRLAVGATPVPDVFIDTYMAGASGEYVKVYLYLLRHQQEEVSIGQIADALNHTEADVQRALAYWQRAGVLGTEVGEEAQRSFQETPGQQISPVLLQRNPWQALVPLRHLQKLPRGKSQPAICHA